MQTIPDLFRGPCGDSDACAHTLAKAVCPTLPPPRPFFPSNQLLQRLHLKQLRRTEPVWLELQAGEKIFQLLF